VPRGAKGHEQHGHRYAVVLQSDEFWPLSTVVIAPTSQSAHPREYRPFVSVRDHRTVVLVDQLGASDLSRFGNPVGRVSEPELSEIDSAVILFLGLSERL
jgi:mRNA interferase MazF